MTHTYSKVFCENYREIYKREPDEPLETGVVKSLRSNFTEIYEKFFNTKPVVNTMPWDDQFGVSSVSLGASVFRKFLETSIFVNRVLLGTIHHLDETTFVYHTTNAAETFTFVRPKRYGEGIFISITSSIEISKDISLMEISLTKGPDDVTVFDIYDRHTPKVIETKLGKRIVGFLENIQYDWFFVKTG